MYHSPDSLHFSLNISDASRSLEVALGNTIITYKTSILKLHSVTKHLADCQRVFTGFVIALELCCL